MNLLIELNLQDYDPEYYIFSSSKGKMFMPGKLKMHSNTPTNHWRKIVKVELALNVNQYSLKKLSANDMVLLQQREGVHNLLMMAQQQMGHVSSGMTEVYADAHKKIIQDVIRRKMPIL